MAGFFPAGTDPEVGLRDAPPGPGHPRRQPLRSGDRRAVLEKTAANTAEEARREGRDLGIPYWRTLKADGSLNEKFPGGPVVGVRTHGRECRGPLVLSAEGVSRRFAEAPRSSPPTTGSITAPFSAGWTRGTVSSARLFLDRRGINSGCWEW